MRTSLSTFLGLSVETAIATTLHLPGLFPLLFSFTTTPEVGPHVALSPDGENFRDFDPRHLLIAFTGLSELAVQGLAAWFAQSCRLKVHDPPPLLTPVTVPPFVAASGTPENPTRHSVVSSMTA